MPLLDMSHFIMYLDQWCINLERSVCTYEACLHWGLYGYSNFGITLLLYRTQDLLFPFLIFDFQATLLDYKIISYISVPMLIIKLSKICLNYIQ